MRESDRYKRESERKERFSLRFTEILQANDCTEFPFDTQSSSSDVMPVYLAGLTKLIGQLILMFKVTGVCPEAINYHLYLIIFHN